MLVPAVAVSLLPTQFKFRLDVVALPILVAARADAAQFSVAPLFAAPNELPVAARRMQANGKTRLVSVV